jgi:hypothetical protein
MYVISLVLDRVRHQWIATIYLGWSVRCHHSLIILIHLVLHNLDVIGQRLIGLPQLMVTMSKRAIITKFTLALGLEKSANLRFVVAVGNVHHFEHEFVRKWLKQKQN